MTNSIPTYPKVLTAKECKKALLEYMQMLKKNKYDEAASRMWKARAVLSKYIHNEDLSFEAFCAYDDKELNLQAQWKIASCYYAALDENNDMSMSDALGIVDDIEWFAYEFAYELDEGEDMWPAIIIFGDMLDSII